MDIISINFAEKLPFRLKLPMIKAAIEVLFLLDFVSVFGVCVFVCSPLKDCCHFGNAAWSLF